MRIAPPDTDVRNPAFDVTPAELITGIVTEEGVMAAPFETSLSGAVTAARRAGPRCRASGAIRTPVAAAD